MLLAYPVLSRRSALEILKSDALPEQSKRVGGWGAARVAHDRHDCTTYARGVGSCACCSRGSGRDGRCGHAAIASWFARHTRGGALCMGPCDRSLPHGISCAIDTHPCSQGQMLLALLAETVQCMQCGSGRRWVSTVSPRRTAECDVLGTGTHARFGEQHALSLHARVGVPTAKPTARRRGRCGWACRGLPLFICDGV